MTPAQECAQHIAVLVAGLDSKLNELEALLTANADVAMEDAHDSLTAVLRSVKYAVERFEVGP